MVDQEKVEAAIKLLLEGIGEDPTREGLLETPARVARMYGEIAGGMDQSAEEHLSKTFAVASNDLVIERDITFYSLCEHHLLPFYGKATIGYIPTAVSQGSLSLLARLRFMPAVCSCRSSCVRRLPMPHGVSRSPGSDCAHGS